MTPTTCKLYNPRHPERTLLYRTVSENFETWLELASAGQFDGQGDHHTPKAYVRQAFRKYLECGIFAHGFARARCDDCGHDYFVAFSCKGRGVCPSCNTRRMAETAAHLVDHVLPHLPVRQWVLSVPKRLRYFMQRDGAVLNMVLRIFLRVIAQSLHQHCPTAAQMNEATLHIGAVAFIHRFGSSLNEHVHFHVCVVDGMFEGVPGESDADATSPGVLADTPKLRFHPVTEIDETAVAQVQANLRRRILRAFVGRSLIDRVDALVPPPRTHRHRYFGVLAPNSPLRAAVTAMAAPAKQAVVQPEPTGASEGAPGVIPQDNTDGGGTPLPQLQLQPEPPKHSPAHYLWAVLIARIYEIFPLLCPICGGQMHLIAFITEGAQIRKILDHIGVDSEPPRISPARGPPLWEDCNAQVDDGVQIEPDWDLVAQPAPDYEVDQRINW